MKLTADQEKIIAETVDAHGLEIQTLRDDLIDHLCCVVESELESDSSFQQILEKAIQDLAPKGLLQIQHQTVFLLNAKRILFMKRLMYTIGFIGSAALTAGAAFKVLHLPFGGPLFMVGFLTLLLVFIPLLAIDRYKVIVAKTLSVRLKMLLGVAAAIVSGLAGLFKILHWQGADLLLLLGSFLFAFGFLPFFFFTMYKKSVS